MELFDEINAQLDYLGSSRNPSDPPKPASAPVLPLSTEMDLETARLGGSDLQCSRIGLGGASLGDLYLPIPTYNSLARVTITADAPIAGS